MNTLPSVDDVLAFIEKATLGELALVAGSFWSAIRRHASAADIAFKTIDEATDIAEREKLAGK